MHAYIRTYIHAYIHTYIHRKVPTGKWTVKHHDIDITCYILYYIYYYYSGFSRSSSVCWISPKCFGGNVVAQSIAVAKMAQMVMLALVGKALLNKKLTESCQVISSQYVFFECYTYRHRYTHTCMHAYTHLHIHTDRQPDSQTHILS